MMAMMLVASSTPLMIDHLRNGDVDVDGVGVDVDVDVDVDDDDGMGNDNIVGGLLSSSAASSSHTSDVSTTRIKRKRNQIAHHQFSILKAHSNLKLF